MSQEKVFQVGGVELHVDNRSITDDGGPSVRVYGDVDGEAVQLLRFDCFRKDPHYHYDPSVETTSTTSIKRLSPIQLAGRWNNSETTSRR